MTTIQSQIAIPIHMCSHTHRTGQTKDCLLFDLSRTYCSFLICSLRLSSRKFIAVITNIIIIICLWFNSWWFICYYWGVIFKNVFTILGSVSGSRPPRAMTASFKQRSEFSQVHHTPPSKQRKEKERESKAVTGCIRQGGWKERQSRLTSGLGNPNIHRHQSEDHWVWPRYRTDSQPTSRCYGNHYEQKHPED